MIAVCFGASGQIGGAGSWSLRAGTDHDSVGIYADPKLQMGPGVGVEVTGGSQFSNGGVKDQANTLVIGQVGVEHPAGPAVS